MICIILQLLKMDLHILNLIEITIAFDNDTATLTQALEGVLNPYMNSAGFASVNL